MEDVLSLVKLRLDIKDNKLDNLILSYTEEIGNRIKHFCGINTIPQALNFVWSSMVIDVLKIEQAHIDEIARTINTGQSVTIGDTTVSPAKSDGVTSTNKSSIDTIVLNYQSDLISYRKLRW